MTRPTHGVAHLRIARQQGATLLVAILMLLVITLLALSSLRGVSLESRITGNLKQQRILTNAAEAGLRRGEASISEKTAPQTATSCTTSVCMPWSLADMGSTSNIDTPTRFTSGNANSMATNNSAYDVTVQWYVVDLGKLNVSSQDGGALTGKGVRYYEVNSCASASKTVACTGDTTTQRVILRTVVARYYQ